MNENNGFGLRKEKVRWIKNTLNIVFVLSSKVCIQLCMEGKQHVALFVLEAGYVLVLDLYIISYSILLFGIKKL